MNKQEKQRSKNSSTRTTVWWLPEGRGGGGLVKGKGDKYIVMNDDLALGGGHTVQYTGNVS